MRERFEYFPALPEPWPRPDDYVPADRESRPHAGEPKPPGPERPPVAVHPGQNGEREKQPRLTLTGRLGSAVTYGQTPKGQPKAHFILGVHTPTEAGITTDWKAVLAFGERVAQLRALSLTRGEAARVIGYLHTREQTKNGKTRIVEEVYAVAIQRL